MYSAHDWTLLKCPFETYFTFVCLFGEAINRKHADFLPIERMESHANTEHVHLVPFT